MKPVRCLLALIVSAVAALAFRGEFDGLMRGSGSPSVVYKFEFETYKMPYLLGERPAVRRVPAEVAVELEAIDGPDDVVWLHNGQPVVSNSRVTVSGRKLIIPLAQSGIDDGEYSLQGLIGVRPLLLKVDPSSFNDAMALSARGYVVAKDHPMILGFAIAGDETREVLVRAIGPSLRNFGVYAPLQEPVIEIYNVQGKKIGEGRNNDGNALPVGGVTIHQASGAFPVRAGTNDQFALLKLKPGNYTAVISAKDTFSGEVLGEVYILGYRSGFLAEEKAAE
jgi:hypothetical protein